MSVDIDYEYDTDSSLDNQSNATPTGNTAELSENYENMSQLTQIDGSSGKAEMFKLDMHHVSQNPDIRLVVRVMKRNHQFYVGKIVKDLGAKNTQFYSSRFISYWTEKVKLRANPFTNFGAITAGLFARLGINGVPNLRLCVDGFYGYIAYGNVFGKHGPTATPWMTISKEASPYSLQLSNGDNIFLSASNDALQRNAETCRMTATSGGNH